MTTYRTDDLEQLVQRAKELGAARVALEVVLPEPSGVGPFTPPQVAEIRGVSADTVRAWVKSGELRAVKIGKRRIQITAEALAEFDRLRQTVKLPQAKRRRKASKLLVQRYSA